MGAVELSVVPLHTRAYAPVSLDFLYFRSLFHYIWFQQSVTKIIIQLLCYCSVSGFIQGGDAEIKLAILVIYVCCSVHSIVQFLPASAYQFIQNE